MKKVLIGGLFLIFAFLSINTALAQTPYKVQNIEVNDDNCQCSDPIVKEMLIVITSIATQQVVENSGWQPLATDFSGSGAIAYDTFQDYYSVTVFVRYTNNGIVCCSGHVSENTTGGDLYDQTFYFTSTVVLN
jgi:hypothetical protein